MFDRGYTGHEHLAIFGLINMNARLYDAALGRFLSPDPYIQAPDFTQSYNRYAYALNNPMKFTDPDGEFPLLFLIGAVIGGYMGGAASNDWEWNPGNWDWNANTFFSIGFGALAGGLTLQAGFGPNGWFTGGGGPNIGLGLDFGGKVKALASFSLDAGKLAWQGAGYITAAGGGLWASSLDWSASERNVHKAITYANNSYSRLREQYANSDLYFESGGYVNVGVQAGGGVEFNNTKFKVDANFAAIDIVSGNIRQVGDNDSSWETSGRYMTKGGYSTVTQGINIGPFGYLHSFDSRGEGYISGTERHTFNVGPIFNDTKGLFRLKLGGSAAFILGVQGYVEFGLRRKK